VRKKAHPPIKQPIVDRTPGRSHAAAPGRPLLGNIGPGRPGPTLSPVSLPAEAREHPFRLRMAGRP
jgi:hypothetical protein